MAATEAQQPAPRTISVTGTAVGFVPADAIIWNITLKSTGTELSEVKALSDKQVKWIVDELTKKGIQGSDMVIGIPKIQDARLAEDGRTAQDISKHLSLSRTVTVRQRDPKQFAGILDVLTRGTGYTMNYTVVSSKTEQITKETMVKATQAAKDKASAMAAVLGAKIGNVLSINEYPPAGWKVPDETVPIDENSSAIGADAEKVRTTVFVTFELQ